MPHSRRNQYIGCDGFLTEDGVLDEQAAWMAAYTRVPERITRREAMLAVYYMMCQGHDSTYISARLNINMSRVANMMKKVRDGVSR